MQTNYKFSEEEIQELSERIAGLLLPILVETLKDKARYTINQLQGDHLTVAQVADMFQCSKQHVYRLCNEGVMSHTKIGGRGIRISRAIVEQAHVNRYL